MDYFGLQVPKTMEGTTMLETFRNPTVAPHSEVFIEWGRYEVDHDGFDAYQPIRCVRSDRYKLSIHLVTTDELYDLETDPGELNNLIDSSEHAGIRNELHYKLLNWMNVLRDPFCGYYWGNRPWRPDFPETWENAGMTRQRESSGFLQRELDYRPIDGQRDTTKIVFPDVQQCSAKELQDAAPFHLAKATGGENRLAGQPA